jgi:hypothetical protein
MSGQCEGQPSAWIQGLHQSWPIRVSKKPFPPQKKPKSSDHANSYSQMLARVGHSHAQGCQVWRRYPFLDMVQFSRQQRNVPELCFRGADWWIWRRQVPSTFRGQPRKRQQFVTTMSATDGTNFPKATVGGGQGGGEGAPSSYAAPTQTSAPAYSAPAATTVASQVSSSVASYQNQKGRETQTTFATLTSTQQQSVAAPTAEASAPTDYSSGSSNSQSNSTSSGTSCLEDGALICIGSDSFGICDHGSAVSRPLAHGTVCKDGVISGANRFRRHVHGAHKH